MEPTTFALIAGCTLASGATGWLVGRGRQPVVEEDDPAPPRPDPRVAELDRENRMLRTLAGVSGTERAPSMGALYGGFAESLATCLADVASGSNVDGAVFVDSSGLVIAPGDASGLERGAASLLSRVWAHSSARRVALHDDRGTILEAHAFESGVLSFWLVTVSKSRRVAPAVVGRCRYRFEGLGKDAEGTQMASRLRLAATDTPVADVLARMTEAMAVTGVGLFDVDGEASLITRGLDPYDRIGADAVRRVIVYCQSRPDFGHPDSLVLENDSESVGFHPFECAKGRRRTLALVMPKQQEYPIDRIGQWTGQIAWQLPRLEASGASNDRAAGGAS